jgi:hypothetical protein
MLFYLRLNIYSKEKMKRGKEQISVLARSFVKEFSFPVYGVV